MTTSDPSPPSAEAHAPRSASAKLFDVRLLIGGLFAVYGVLLTVYSFFDTTAEREKAAGIHINLWLGLAMLVVGIVFAIWARLQPARPAEPSTPDTGRPAHH